MIVEPYKLVHCLPVFRTQWYSSRIWTASFAHLFGNLLVLFPGPRSSFWIEELLVKIFLDFLPVVRSTFCRLATCGYFTENKVFFVFSKSGIWKARWEVFQLEYFSVPTSYYVTNFVPEILIFAISLKRIQWSILVSPYDRNLRLESLNYMQFTS